MGFSKSVKEQVLIKSARHCCVCHRYKGVKVEVHHIKPEESGGSNIYENAIALCFDCHADAGHYNPKHPRGSKFSQSELEKARDKWFEIVINNSVSQPEDPEHLYCRYYLCKNYQQLVEIANGNLSCFPVKKPLLIKNQIINILNRIIRIHGKSYRHANAWGKQFLNRNEYTKLYPYAIISDRTDGKYSYFEVIRTPSKEELEKLSSEDGLLKIMLEADLPIQKIAKVGSYNTTCGDDCFQEEYILRDLWCSFLAITNVSNQPIQLTSIKGNFLDGFKFQSLFTSSTKTQKISLPKAYIQSNATVLIPLAIIIPPFYPFDIERWSEIYDDETHNRVVSHEGITSISFEDFIVYRNQIITKSIIYKIHRQYFEQNLHDFDLGNMYTINRYWECGSCPHLFFIGNIFIYSREILAHCESKIGIDCFKVPDDITAIVIAEIEDEVTQIVSLSINEESKLQNVYLKKNQFVELSAQPGSLVEIVGQYLPNKVAKQRLLSGIKRNELVGQFLKVNNKGLTNVYTQKNKE